MIKMTKVYDLADFTPYPIIQYKVNGGKSGEEFCDVLDRLIKETNKTKILLDNVHCHASCFLQEAFGGLIYRKGYTKDEVNNKLELVTRYRSIKVEIDGYLS